jgi:hypothetical protein
MDPKLDIIPLPKGTIVKMNGIPVELCENTNVFGNIANMVVMFQKFGSAELGALAGSKTTPKKAQAARQNGKLGGRPRAKKLNKDKK